ncbi:hypothetical protein [Sphingomonas morindae]|uniref:Uncharacterized protein n=1 Tax=Sphingomonas morindae TaxID=1541170 RepID=A0ABY4X426_9SPHN|nr:hypothetical protein [Sphingomonas morindae]USI71628.1 hypothetical protein LHA26_09795 [Sphingomonas morindae]
MATSRKIKRQAERARANEAARAAGALSTREPLVTPEAARQGDYAEEQFVDAAGQRPIVVMRNRGGTTVERWFARGDLSRGQAEALALYARCWRMWIGEQRVVANWSLTPSFRDGAASIDDFAATRLAAKAKLDHFDDAIFFSLPLHYLETWRNVVIFDEAAGVAGSRLGYRNDGAQAAAKAIVLLIADMIATDLRLG